jgi:hypothetical protein
MSCLHGMYSSSACALCVAPVNIARNREEYERKAKEQAQFRIAHPLMKANKFRSAIATNAPCHADCWFAVGDTCQCSCAGRNHGIGRNPSHVLAARSPLERLASHRRPLCMKHSKQG